jgi:endonuclease YncB( thermonuclease family)
MKMKKLWLVISIFWCSVCWASEVKVVDGDSLELNGTRIRLDGIDAPEFFQLCEDKNGKEYPCGQDSTTYLRDLIGANVPRCECNPQTDKYNRHICECFVGDVSLNQKMVYDGWARVYRSSKYAANEENAAEQHRGIWQGRHMRPALYRILQRYTAVENDAQKSH